MWAVYSGEVGGVSYNYNEQSEDGHCQAPKHVVVPCVINTIHTATIK